MNSRQTSRQKSRTLEIVPVSATQSLAYPIHRKQQNRKRTRPRPIEASLRPESGWLEGGINESLPANQIKVHFQTVSSKSTIRDFGQQNNKLKDSVSRKRLIKSRSPFLIIPWPDQASGSDQNAGPNFMSGKPSNSDEQHFQRLRNSHKSSNSLSHFSTVRETENKQAVHPAQLPAYHIKGRILQGVPEPSAETKHLRIDMQRSATSYNFTVSENKNPINKSLPESIVLSQLDSKQAISANSSLIRFMIPKNTTYIEATFDTQTNCLFPLLLVSTSNFTSIVYANDSGNESFSFDVESSGSVGFRVNPALEQLTFYPKDLSLEIQQGFSSQMVSLSSDANAHPTYGSLYCPLFANPIDKTFTASIRIIRPISKTRYDVDWKMIEGTNLPFPVMLSIPAAGESTVSFDKVEKPLKFIFSTLNMKVAIMFEYFENNVKLSETRDFSIDGMIEMTCPATSNLTVTLQNKDGFSDLKMRVLILKAFVVEGPRVQPESSTVLYITIAGGAAILITAVVVFILCLKNRKQRAKQTRKQIDFTVISDPAPLEKLTRHSPKATGFKSRNSSIDKSLAISKKSDSFREPSNKIEVTENDSECNSPNKSEIDSEITELKRPKLKLSKFSMGLRFEGDLEFVGKPKD